MGTNAWIDCARVPWFWLISVWVDLTALPPGCCSTICAMHSMVHYSIHTAMNWLHTYAMAGWAFLNCITSMHRFLILWRPQLDLMLDITKEHYASVLCTWLLPRLQSMHAITTSSVHHVCCGLQFKADDYTDFHSISLSKNVYDTMCAHGLHALEAYHSSDALVLSVDHTTV